MRAALYLRISQDQVGDAAGVTRQREDCVALAESRGWIVADVYQDNDKSATSGKRRPEYERLLVDIKAGKLDAIVVWHPDRLYRRMVDLTELLEVVQAHKVQVATVRAGDVDLSTPTGQMIAEILASVAQYEVRQKSDRWKRSVQQRRERGDFAPSGKRLFGYTADGEIVPDEARHVRRLYKELLEGASVTGLCRKLNTKGVLTTQHNEWRTSNLKAYLLNPRLAGYATIGGEIIGDGSHKAIVDREKWAQANAILSARVKIGPRVRKALLPGLLFCGVCGTRLVTGSVRNRRTYRCSKAPGIGGCEGVSIYAEPVEEIVEGAVKAYLDDPRVWENLATIQSTAGAAELAAEATALEARVVEIEAALAEPGTPVAVLLRQLGTVKDKLAEARNQLATLQPVPDMAKRRSWPDDLQQRRRLIELVVARVDIDPVPPGVRGKFVPERVRITRVS